MRIEVQAIAAGEVDADVLAVPLQAGDGLAGATAELDQSLGGLLAQLREVGELRDDLGSARLVHLSGQVRARRVAAAGVGEPEQFDADALRTAAASVALGAGEFAQTVAWVLDPSLPLPLEQQARALVEGTVLGTYEPARWKHENSSTARRTRRRPSDSPPAPPRSPRLSPTSSPRPSARRRSAAGAWARSPRLRREATTRPGSSSCATSRRSRPTATSCSAWSARRSHSTPAGSRSS